MGLVDTETGKPIEPTWDEVQRKIVDRAISISERLVEEQTASDKDLDGPDTS